MLQRRTNRTALSNSVHDGCLVCVRTGIRTTWRATCRRAKIEDLHFHDLRREFASRLLESGAPQHVVRDFLGHASIGTTSRYLATTSVVLEHAMRRFEEHQNNCHTVATSTAEATAANSPTDSTEVLNQ